MLLALTPTLYGLPNDLLHIDNGVVGAGFGGWATLVAAAAGVLAFVVTALLTSSHETEEHDLRSLDRMTDPAIQPAVLT